MPDSGYGECLVGKSPRVCMIKWRGILRWVSLQWVSLQWLSLRIIKMVGNISLRWVSLLEPLLVKQLASESEANAAKLTKFAHHKS